VMMADDVAACHGKSVSGRQWEQDKKQT